MDDDTIQDWYWRYQEDGVEGLTIFDHEGGDVQITRPPNPGAAESLDRRDAAVLDTRDRRMDRAGVRH